MRKANSDFKTAFISEAGADVVNNDYFGFVELDDYACYVIADGLYDLTDVEGARLAIETVVQKFQENPSMKKRTLNGYLKAANKRLVAAEKKRISMKVSVTVVVTNYEAMRYASAGNTRLYLYRGKETVVHSQDMSLGRAMLEKEDSSLDKLAVHQERNNLYSFLGQASGFSPYISKKIKLKETDIITLFTRGIWEHVDDGELGDVFEDATDDPQESVELVEELLLSRQPENLDNYTIAAIFVNKLFADPKRRKRINKIILISVIILVVAAIIVVVVLLFQKDRREKQESMENALDNVIVFISHDNYTKALDEAETAYELAEKIKDKDKQTEIDEYIKLIESILDADELLKNGEYEDAQTAYLAAQEYSMALNQVGNDYIEKKLAQCQQYINFYDLMELGNSLAEFKEYDTALSIYKEARELASSLYFMDGKQQALDAIERLYQQIADDEAAAQKAADDAQAEKDAAEAAAQAEQDATDAAAQAEKDAAQEAADEEAAKKEAEEQEKAAASATAAELLAQGDVYYGQGDYEAAKTYYQLARNKYSELGDSSGVSMADSKIQLAEKRIKEADEQKALADSYVTKGDELYTAGNYTEAKRYYTLARQLYNNLSLPTEVAKVDNKLEILELAVKEAEAQSQSEAAALEINATEELPSQSDFSYKLDDYVSAIN